MGSNPDGKTAKRGPYAKSRLRRESIVAAAHQVFAAHGYRGGSLQDVADKVGMSQTSLLHYFPSKSELLLAVLVLRDSVAADGKRADGNPAGEIARASDGIPSGLEESFVDAVIRQARFNETVPGVIELYTVLCAESLTEGHPGKAYFTDRYQRLRESYASRFRALAEEGRLREGVDPERAAATLIAVWDGIQTQWLMAPENVDMAGCLRDYLDLVVLPG